MAQLTLLAPSFNIDISIQKAHHIHIEVLERPFINWDDGPVCKTFAAQASMRTLVKIPST